MRIAEDPPTPPPSDERCFTDWSSLEFPHVRTSPQNVPIREMGQSINQPDNQTTQPGSDPVQIGATGNAFCDNVSSPRNHQQPDEGGVRMTDMGTNMSDIEVRPHSDGTRVVTLDANIQTPLPIVDVMIPTSGEDQIALPQINLSISGYGPNSLRDSQLGSSDVRAQEISILLHVDGLISAPTREYTRGRISESARIMEWEYSQGGTYIQGAPITQRREYLGDSSDDNRSHRGWRPPERGRYPNQNGRPPDRGRYPDRDRRPPRRGGYPGGGPPDGGGPPAGGGPPDGNGGPPVDKDHQVLKDLLDQ